MEVMAAEDVTLSPSRMGWQSPRISFCHDILYERGGEGASSDNRNIMESGGGFSSEFEFCMLQNASDLSFLGQNMSSADELFLNGRLLPLHTASQELFSEEKSDIDKPSPEDFGNIGLTTEQPSGSAQKVDISPPTASCLVVEENNCEQEDDNMQDSLSKIESRAPKLGSRLKEIFKLGRLQVSTQKELNESKREGSNVPLSPRSIWPFSRSSSAGEPKTKSASCSLASSRSNSAGDKSNNKACSAPCSRSNSASDSKTKARSGLSSRIHMDLIPRNSSVSSSSSSSDDNEAKRQQESCPQEGGSDVVHDERGLENNEYDGVPRKKAVKKKRMPKDKKAPKNCPLVDGGQPRVKICGSPGRPIKLRSPSRNYGRSSPVRVIGNSRAGACSPGKVSSSKFMIKNFDKCPASNPKTMTKSQDAVWPSRHKDNSSSKMSERMMNSSSYSPGVRVLNVPVCIGHSRAGRSSNSRLFNLKGFFSRTGNKQSSD